MNEVELKDPPHDTVSSVQYVKTSGDYLLVTSWDKVEHGWGGREQPCPHCARHMMLEREVL